MKLTNMLKALSVVGVMLATSLSCNAQFRVYNGKANTSGTGKFNMTLKAITNNFSADLIAVSVKNVRKVSQASQKKDTASVSTGSSNLQGMNYWSGVKNPMSNNINFSTTGRLSTEFYVVTQWTSGFGGLIGATGGKFVGRISVNGQNRDVYRSTNVTSTDPKGVKYKHNAVWVLCQNVNPVNAGDIVRQCNAKGWVGSNEYIQWWYRYIECYNNTGKTLNGEARIWFK